MRFRRSGARDDDGRVQQGVARRRERVLGAGERDGRPRVRSEGRDQHGGDILRARVRPGRRELDEARERRRVGLVGNRMRVQRVERAERDRDSPARSSPAASPMPSLR